jgi:hypothetical protein
MERELLQERRVPTLERLKEIISTDGPCISLTVSMEGTGGQTKPVQTKLKHALADAERLLTAAGIDQEQRRTLLDPVQSYAEEFDAGEPTGGGLLILRSADLFRVIRLASNLQESVTVGNHFEIRPLLHELDANRQFVILALAQKNIRMLRCTDHSSEEVPLPEGIPKDMQTWAQTRKPDHNMTNKASAGPSAGSSKGVMQTTNTDREDKDEYLLHFYKEVDKGLNDALKGESGIPVVLVGVDYELALYHKISTYPHLIPDGVHGAPDGLKGGEMHKRALEIVRGQLDPGLEKALQLYETNVSAGRTSHQVNQVVRSAFEGRVSHLLLADGATQMGNFDEATQRVRQHGSPLPGDEDLLNAAALQTVLHGEEVYLLPRQLVPNNSVIAAVLRY